MLLHHRFELTDQVCVQPEEQVGVDAVFDRREPRLFEPGDHRSRERIVSEVDECGAAPQCERVAERRRRRFRLTSVEGSAALRREPVETGRIESIPWENERVATSACCDPVFTERASQARHVDLQVVAGRDPLAAPDVLEQLVGRHRVSLGQRKVDEQCARTRAADVDGNAVIVEHFERPQDSELHGAPR